MSCHGSSQCRCFRSLGWIRQLSISTEESTCGQHGCSATGDCEERFPEDRSVCDARGNRNDTELVTVPIRCLSDSEHSELELDQGYQSYTELVIRHGLLRPAQEPGHNMVERGKRV